MNCNDLVLTICCVSIEIYSKVLDALAQNLAHTFMLPWHSLVSSVMHKGLVLSLKLSHNLHKQCQNTSALILEKVQVRKQI